MPSYDYDNHPPPPPGWPAVSWETLLSYDSLATGASYDAVANHSPVSQPPPTDIFFPLLPFREAPPYTPSTFTATHDTFSSYHYPAASTFHNANTDQLPDSESPLTDSALPILESEQASTHCSSTFPTQKRSYYSAFYTERSTPLANDDEYSLYPGHIHDAQPPHHPGQSLRYTPETPPILSSTPAFFSASEYEQHLFAHPVLNTPAFCPSTSQLQPYTFPDATQSSLSPVIPRTSAEEFSGMSLGGSDPVLEQQEDQVEGPLTRYAYLKEICPPDNFCNPVARINVNGKILRVSNPFFLFLAWCAVARRVTQKASELLNSNPISKAVSQIWKSLTHEEKAYWQERGRQVKEKNQELHPGYKYQPVQNSNKKRKTKTPEVESPLVQPMETQPKAAAKPRAAKPKTAKPKTAKPKTTKPKATKPRAIEPGAKKDAVVEEAPLTASPPMASRSVSPITGPSPTTTFDAHHEQHSLDDSVTPTQGLVTMPTSQFTFVYERSYPPPAAGRSSSGYTASPPSCVSPESSGPQTPFSVYDEEHGDRTVIVDSPNLNDLGDGFVLADWLNVESSKVAQTCAVPELHE